MDRYPVPPPSSAPEGKFMSTVSVGPKGQIVIPKKVRDMFDIKPGDTLLLLADQNQGIAIHHYEALKAVVDVAFSHYQNQKDSQE